MSNIPSPYNFVPASTHIHIVERQISHDHPVADGVCGSIDITVTNETPMFIRGTTKPQGHTPEKPYRLDERWAIPGSSLRGLIRTVVEIASFSRLGPVNDLKLGFRDLQNRDLYGVHMAAMANQQPTPKVSACWLKRNGAPLDIDINEENENDPVATLEVVDYMKVEYGLLAPLLADRGFNLGERNSAPNRYRALGVQPGVKKTATFPAHQEKVREHGAVLDGYRAIGEVLRTDPVGRQKITGTLVITGQPSEYRMGAPKKHGAGNPKHHDFLFFGAPRAKFEVTRRQFSDFEFIHAADMEKHGQRSTPNPEWAFWKGAFDGDESVPVFAIFTPESASGRQVRSFGLASMFRLAFDLSIREALVRNTQPERHLGKLDFAEALFGRVPQGRSQMEGDAALKGRVSFDTLVAESGSPQYEAAPVEAVFGAPKPSYYPNYIENGVVDPAWGTAVPAGSAVQGAYQTLMDKTASLRGWKRYALQDAVAHPPQPDKVKDHQKSRFTPLKPGVTFRGKLRFHNVTLVEVGALLWALDFGADARARHAIGLGKPYGYGRIKIAVTGSDIRPNDPTTVARPDFEASARKAFVDHMEAWAAAKKIPAAWRNSLHIENLVALARPASGNPIFLAYPTLKPNEFTNAKRPENRFTLAPAVPFDAWKQRRESEGVVLPPVSWRQRAGGGGAPSPGGGPNRGGPPPGRGPAPAAQTPAKMLMVVPSGDTPEGCAKLVIQASIKGGQFALVRTWMAEGGAAEVVRRAGALKGLGGLTDKLKAKHPDIAEWLGRG